MKTTIKIKLAPSQQQQDILKQTLEQFNSACNFIAEVAFQEKSASKFGLQKLVYHEVREKFGLSAQMTIRAIAKVCEAYKRDKKIKPTFRPHSALVYDQRIMAFKGLAHVSLWTLEERQIIPFYFAKYLEGQMDRVQGQADLVLIDGIFYLFCTCETPEDTPIDTNEFLGVDLGIVNIASDSQGTIYTGEKIEHSRKRHNSIRQRLQRKGTHSAKKHLNKISRQEKRFKKDTNHIISKSLVETAKDTNQAIALEDLKGIRKRTTVRTNQRNRHSSWAFGQLRSFIEYKAKLSGIPVVLVNPKYTSQECSECGHIEKKNRKSQSEFVCQQCDHSEHADLNAPKVIKKRAELSTSLLSSVV